MRTKFREKAQVYMLSELFRAFLCEIHSRRHVFEKTQAPSNQKHSIDW